MKRIFLTVIMLVWISSCAGMPAVIGKWQQPGRSATVQFNRDGTFTAVDNQGMAVNGKYCIMKKNRVRFEIDMPDAPPEIINGTYVLDGQRLTLTSADGEDVDVYQKTGR